MACCNSDNVCFTIDNETKTEILNNYYCPNYKIKPRTYLQFNDLVFDGQVTTENSSVSFLDNMTPYLGKIGSLDTSAYNGKLLPTAAAVSLTVALPFEKLNRLQVINYFNFIKRNLAEEGKLWAVDAGGQLIWTWARVTNYSETDMAITSQLSFSLEFAIPSGIWFIADVSKVYLIPYDRCDFQQTMQCCGSKCLLDPFANCKGLNECNNCEQCETLLCELCDDMRYCNTPWDPYDDCQSDYQIKYSCQNNSEKLWSNFTVVIRQNLPSSITGTFCSDTILDGGVEILLVGSFHNPEIIINEETIKISGDYKGILKLNSDGSIKYYPNAQTGELCGSQDIDFEKVTYCNGKVTLSIKSCENIITVYGAETNYAQAIYLDLKEVTF